MTFSGRPSGWSTTSSLGQQSPRCFACTRTVREVAGTPLEASRATGKCLVDALGQHRSWNVHGAGRHPFRPHALPGSRRVAGGTAQLLGTPEVARGAGGGRGRQMWKREGRRGAGVPATGPAAAWEPRALWAGGMEQVPGRHLLEERGSPPAGLVAESDPFLSSGPPGRAGGGAGGCILRLRPARPSRQLTVMSQMSGPGGTRVLSDSGP